MAPESSDVDYCLDVSLSPGEVVGLSFTTQSGTMSAVAVVGLLGVITVKYVKRVRNKANRSWKLVRTNIDGLMARTTFKRYFFLWLITLQLNLLGADLFMSFGAILDAKWASSEKVHCGGYCNAQGGLQLVGETSVALFTLEITVLSFISILRDRPVKCRVAVWGGISGVVWLFVILWAIIGYKTHLGDRKDSFYAPTPYWCWISPRYKVQRLIGEYVWLWIAGFGSILLYIPLFFMLRGDITWNPQTGWRSLRWNRRTAEPEPEQGDESSVASSQSGVSPFALLWYPLAYTLCVLPMSVVRWITFGHQGHPTPDVATATFVAVFIFNLSGLANVVLILCTRAGVLLLDSEPDGNGDEDGDRIPRPRREKRSVSPSPSPEATPRHESGFGGPCLATRDRDSDFDTGRVNRTRHQHGLSDGSSGSDSGAYK